MKKSLYISLIGIVGLSLAGCGSPVSTGTEEAPTTQNVEKQSLSTDADEEEATELPLVEVVDEDEEFDFEPIAIDEEHFPDEVLRTAVADCFDDDEDGVLSSEEIGYAEILDVHGSRRYGMEPSDDECKSLEGIEYLPNLIQIIASNNGIEEVDLSKNEKLEGLYISNNILKELDLSECPSLTKVSCDYNMDLTTIKFNNPNIETLNCFSCSIEDLDLSSLESLDYLHCGNNLLTEIDLSHNSNLRIAYLRGNYINELDVSKNINLEDLGIGDNPIESIDVSANENLKALTCGWSKMKALDLSHNPNLDRLAIDETPIETIDVSANPKLNYFSCQDGEITELDFSNNPEMQYLDIQFLDLKELDISNCPMLIDVIENGKKNTISDRQAWDGVEDHEGQIQVPLNCKLIY